MALNRVSIQGRLCKDPDLRRTGTGKAVCSFDVACDKPGRDSGASFIPCVAWEKTGEFINQYFSKGSQIVLEGRLESRQYETKEGQKRTVLEVVVSQAHFCGKKEEPATDCGKKEEPATDNKFTCMSDNYHDPNRQQTLEALRGQNYAVLDEPDAQLPF